MRVRQSVPLTPSISFHPNSLPRKSFRRNTYEPARMCCKQRTYSIANLFRICTYTKHGGGSRLWLTSNSPPTKFSSLPHQSAWSLFQESQVTSHFLLESGQQ